MSAQNKHAPTITLSKGGTGERTVKLETLQIPDCYCIAETVRKQDKVAGDMVNDCWHMAHDLKRRLIEVEQHKATLLAALVEGVENGGIYNDDVAWWHQADSAIKEARGE